jgi:hypothetical protein
MAGTLRPNLRDGLLPLGVSLLLHSDDPGAATAARAQALRYLEPLKLLLEAQRHHRSREKRKSRPGGQTLHAGVSGVLIQERDHSLTKLSQSANSQRDESRNLRKCLFGANREMLAELGF